MNCVEELLDDLSIAVSKKSNYKMPVMHYHNAYEIYFLEEGRRSYIVENDLIQLKPQDVLLIKSGEVHQTVAGKFTSSRIEFPKSYLSRFFSNRGMENILKCFEKRVIRVKESDFEDLIDSLKRLMSDNEDLYAFVNIFAILERNRSGEETKTKSSASKISDILEYINANYATIDTLEDICKELFISKYYLCDLFKEHTGTTIMNYITGIRIQASMEMLSKNDQNIEDIAKNCGFNSVSYFSKVFKRVTGISPAQHRRISAVNKNIVS